jgi:hypothetical protein
MQRSIKGNPPAKEIPIIIPGSGAYMALKNSDFPGFPKGLTIWELGSMEHPICEDIRHDQMWFLRTDPKGYSGEKGGNVLRIWEPGDIQPAELKPYYLAFLTDHAEDILKNYAVGDSVLAKTCRAYLDDMAISRISQIPDPSERVDKLMPYFLKNPEGPARRQIVLSGNAGADKLVPIFTDPKYAGLQAWILEMWTERDYRGADSILTTMLKKENQGLAVQHERERRFGTNDAIMTALRATHDPQALAAMDEFNKRVEIVPRADLEPLPISSVKTPGIGPNGNKPWENSLGVKFVPAGTSGVLFSVWDTRVEDYQAFAQATGREWPKPFFNQGPTHPAVNVSWDDVQLFCQWLTLKERTAGKIGANQIYRLPTDAEWSKAVGLEESADGTPGSKGGVIKGIYPWGTAYPPPEDAGNYLRKGDGSLFSKDTDIEGTDGYAYTSPVGSFKPNRYGLYDMGGNVWQWCEDYLNDEHE